MFSPNYRDIIEVIIRTAVVYCFVLAGLRATGKREVSQMTPFDLTLLLLIANAVQNAMVGSNSSLSAGIVAAATLLILNRFFSAAAARNRRLNRVIKGSP